MWIVLNNAFVSIVDQPPGTSVLLVRARVKGDIARAMGGIKVKEIKTEHADYRFRAVVSRKAVAKAISDHVLAIDYCNFKDSVAPKETKRKGVYMRVWSELYALQEKERAPTMFLEPWGDGRSKSY